MYKKISISNTRTDSLGRLIPMTPPPLETPPPVNCITLLQLRVDAGQLRESDCIPTEWLSLWPQTGPELTWPWGVWLGGWPWLTKGSLHWLPRKRRIWTQSHEGLVEMTFLLKGVIFTLLFFLPGGMKQCKCMVILRDFLIHSQSLTKVYRCL